MKFYVKKIDINTDKKVPDSRIVAISDLHYTRSLGLSYIDAIRSKISLLSPTYICFLGDLVDDDSKEILGWLNDLTNIAPVYMILGNHDISRYIPAKNEFYETNFNQEIANNIKNIKGLELLENGKTIHDNGYSFKGMPYYDICEVDSFINNVNKYDIDLDFEDYNTMLVHNPWIMNSKVFRELDTEYYETDLILSGHTHNGLVPHYLSKVIPGNTGLYAPSQGVFPKMTKGNVKVSEPGYEYDGLIVPALRTLPEKNNTLNSINNVLYPPAIELIRVNKKK